jgi:hypothetical protein
MIMLVSLVLLAIFGPQTSNPASAAQIQANENVRELNLAGIAQLQADAEKGDAAAQMKLGNAYLRAEGVPKNDELAARWFRKAADQGDPAAENQMGNMYRSGIGLSKNKEEAFRWYEKAVRHGDLTAMFNLGTCYYNGDGVASNEYTAYAWFYWRRTLEKQRLMTQQTDRDRRCRSEKPRMHYS